MIKLEKGTFSTVPIKMIKGLNPLYQTVFMWLCHHANEEGICWPSLEILCHECGISHASVTIATKELSRLGYIIKKRRRNNSCTYQIIIKDVKDNNLGMQESSNAKIQQCKNLGLGMQESSNRECKNPASNYNQELKPKELKPYYCSSKDDEPIWMNSFNIFWKRYPRKQSKKDAMKAWKANYVKLGEWLEERILTDIDYKERNVYPNGWFDPVKKSIRLQFVPLPATYIRAERWEDEVLPET